MKLDDFSLQHGAVIDENTVVVVGTKHCDVESDDPNKHDPDRLDPNGFIVDLAGKTPQKFTNGHKAGIFGVSARRGRIATTSNHRDPTLRVWDVKSAKTAAEVEIEKPGEGIAHYGVSWFHKGDRAAVAADERVIVLDPAKPDDREEFVIPPDTARWVSGVAVSPDDAWLACTADRDQVVFWDVAGRKGTAVLLVPPKADESEQWRSRGVAFGPKGTLVAWRCWSKAEVADGKAEADVPAERRGVVRIDMPDGKVVPLGMGQTIYTLSCAIDPTGTWLAAVGTSRPDKPRPDGLVVLSELRVYHLPSKDLAFRDQSDGPDALSWVAFSPSGKRVYAASGGIVKWWEVQEKK